MILRRCGGARVRRCEITFFAFHETIFVPSHPRTFVPTYLRTFIPTIIVPSFRLFQQLLQSLQADAIDVALSAAVEDEEDE